MKILVFALAILLIFSLPAFAQNSATVKHLGVSQPQTQTAPSSSPALVDQRNPRYEVRPGDVCEITFEFTAEFNQTVTVQPDGYVTLRAVGDRYVAGQTVPQLTDTLRTAYAKILLKPVLTVLLKDFEKPYFIADGQVGKPGKYELRSDTTVVEALAIAGGLLDKAKHSQVILFRRVSDSWSESRVINVKKMQKERNLQEDVHLRAGDMLFVPKSRFAKIERFLPTASLNTVARTY